MHIDLRANLLLSRRPLWAFGLGAFPVWAMLWILPVPFPAAARGGTVGAILWLDPDPGRWLLHVGF